MPPSRKRKPKKATREQVVDIARSWKGVQWLHQGHSRDTGADCEGFVEGVFKEGGHVEVIDIVRNYRRRESGSVMLSLLQENLDFVPAGIAQAQPGDILAFCDENLRLPDIPRHLGIYTGQRGDGVHYVIHMGDMTRGVVEHRMNAIWLKRIHSVWRVRGIDG